MDKIRVSEMPKKCPVCGSVKIAAYLWGEPAYSEEFEADLKGKKIILGGCCISDDDPFCACVKCNTDFYNLTNNLNHET